MLVPSNVTTATLLQHVLLHFSAEYAASEIEIMTAKVYLGEAYLSGRSLSNEA